MGVGASAGLGSHAAQPVPPISLPWAWPAPPPPWPALLRPSFLPGKPSRAKGAWALHPQAVSTGLAGPKAQAGTTGDGSRQANRPVTSGERISFASPATDHKRCLELLTVQLALIEAVGAGSRREKGAHVSMCVCLCGCECVRSGWR